MELTKQQGNVMAALKQGNEALKKAQAEVRTCYQTWWSRTGYIRLVGPKHVVAVECDCCCVGLDQASGTKQL
jgi:hypothetical protein